MAQLHVELIAFKAISGVLAVALACLALLRFVSIERLKTWAEQVRERGVQGVRVVPTEIVRRASVISWPAKWRAPRFERTEDEATEVTPAEDDAAEGTEGKKPKDGGRLLPSKYELDDGKWFRPSLGPNPSRKGPPSSVARDAMDEL